MTKKLKIYSTLFVVALIVLVMGDTFHYSSMGWSPAPDNKMEFAELPAEYMTRDTLADGETVSTGHPLITYEVNVHSWSRPDHKVLLSTAQGQTYKVDMKKIKVEHSRFTGGIQGPHVYHRIVCSRRHHRVLLDIMVGHQTHQQIRQGEIFVTKVAKYLEITGILLSVLYLNALATSYLVTQYFIANIHLADHSIVFKNECNSMYILTGLGADDHLADYPDG